MDVEGPSVWTPVPMVRMLRRCVDTSSGDASVPTPLWRHSAPIPPSTGEEVNASQHTSPQGNLTPLQEHVKHDTREGEYLVLSTGEGCGETPVCDGQCPHPPL